MAVYMEMEITGIYINPKNPQDYVKIKDDGVFSYKAEAMYTGKWEARDGKLRLWWTMGLLLTLKIVNNKLIDEFGGVWVKKN